MKKALPRLDYRFGDDGLEITLGKLVLAHTAYDDIANVAPMAAPKLPKLPKLPSWRKIVNRARALWPEPVLVRRRSGWLRRLVIAPKNPSAFVSELQERIDAAAKAVPAEKKEKSKRRAAG
jgi:hypothetical protein